MLVGKRIHFVTRTSDIPGWIGEMLLKRDGSVCCGPNASHSPHHSSANRWRNPQLSFLAYELQYYNFEAEREVVLSDEDPFIVPVVEGEEVKIGSSMSPFRTPSPWEISIDSASIWGRTAQTT